MQTERDVPPAPTKQQVVATGAGLLAATSLVAVVDPYEGGHFPSCPMLALTGWFCPLCGGLRAVHDLTHLDVLGALDRNPLVVVGLPFVVLALLAWGQRAFTGRRIALPWASSGAAVLVLLVVFGVLRNVPGWTWLSPV